MSLELMRYTNPHPYVFRYFGWDEEEGYLWYHRLAY